MEADEKASTESTEEKPAPSDAAKNLDVLWNKVDNLLGRKEGDFKEIAGEISKYVHEIVDIIVSSSDAEYDEVACKFCQQNNIFNKIYNWTGQHRECLRLMAHQQLLFFNKIIENASITLLICKDVIVPLLLLLMSLKPTEKRKVPPDIEKIYVNILYHTSQRITSPEFLDLLSEDMFTSEAFRIPKFTFFELLILYTHHAGGNGDLAREAILFCIQSSTSHQAFQKYITEESAVSVIIAGGLSARYSSLPTTLEILTEEWYYITEEDLIEMTELQSFLQALDFCCQVTDASNAQVRSHLAKLIYDGFLMSVMAPALNQSQYDSQIAVMSYLDLFLRCINSTKVMEVFLKVLMTDAYDNKALITLLIYHINSESVQLSMVAMQLFKTLLELNCEDIIFHLIFRYLLPCDHILPNQKRTIKSVDYYCKSATMFLYLTPSCCIETNKNNKPDDFDNSSAELARHTESSTPGSPRSIRSVNENHSRKSSANSISSRTSVMSTQSDLRPQETIDFLDYLEDARRVISSCKNDCRCWSAVYDGMDVVTEYQRNGKVVHSSASSVDSPVKFQRNHSNSSDNGFTDNITRTKPESLYTTEILGPFLNAIFDKIEVMMENNVYVNLLLTSLISRLACYPQPLLRSFLLNSNLVIRPGVRSLAQVLKRVSDASDAFITRLDDYQVLICKARQNLMSRKAKDDQPGVTASSSEKNEMVCSISLDPITGSTKFQRKELFPEKGEKSISADDLVSLVPDKIVRSASVSVNTSLVKKDNNELKMTATISNPGNVGRLHPALPKMGLKSPNKRSKNFPSKTEVAEIRKKNPRFVKNVVYCVVVLEEFMKELAAISIEQTLQ